MSKEIEAKNNIEVKAETEMNHKTEVKETTAKTAEITKETKTDEEKAVKKSVATKKKATGKNAESTGEKQVKDTGEQTPSAYVDKTVKTDNILPVIKDIEAVRGDVINHTPEEIERFKESCKQIQREQESMQKSYLKIAIPYYNICVNKWFKILGYPDVYSFAKKEFSICRGRCTEFRKLIENFGFIDENTNCCTGIKPEFQNYDVSKLIEMSKMTPEQRAHVTEKTTVTAMQKLRLSGELPKNTSESAPAPKPKKRNYQLFKGDNLESFESLEKSLLSRLSEFTDQHEEIHNIKITLSYEE